MGEGGYTGEEEEDGNMTAIARETTKMPHIRIKAQVSYMDPDGRIISTTTHTDADAHLTKLRNQNTLRTSSPPRALMLATAYGLFHQIEL
ncbi:hypothetical protein OsI_19906 [Oryza sativa Indica Group]|jgi:hypothetical protein|uniref:Uncharacterized protein n=1 Tax=Oryza sativa subsp. indica TaxID=39946 RepID=B8AY34_ORYSI|nr:hypothetical protein OsI_19906 [Oryza sativa Indica Group]